jgi:hypothetical protein
MESAADRQARRRAVTTAAADAKNEVGFDSGN